jgi:AmiR/NasT family two-component response regulator
MLAEYLGVSMDDAFQLLRTFSRDHNRKLSVVARDVIERNIPSSVLAWRGPGQKP